MQFRRAWVEENCSSSVLNIITNGYVLPFHLKPKLTRHPLIISEYKNQQKDLALASCIHSLLNKHAIEKVRNTESLGFYSRMFLVPEPHQKWRPVIDLSRLNQFLRIERFKMETPESIRTSLNTGEWVTSIDLQDAYLHSYSNSPKIAKVPEICTQVSDLSVHLSSIRASPSSSSIHHDSERSKTHGLITGHKDTPIFGRFADQGSISRGIISQHKSGGKPDRISRLDNKSGQIRVDSNSSVLFCGIRIPSELSPCKAHSGEVAKTAGINPQDNQPVCPDCKTFDVAHWVASINRKNGPRRSPSHETLSVASQGELDISSVTGQAPSLVRHHNSSSGLVAESTKCSQRCRSPPPRTQRSSVYRCLKRRLGRSLKSRLYQRTVIRSRKIVAYKRFRTKGSVLGPKTLQASMPKSTSPGCHGQLNGSSLHQQTGRDSLSGNVRPSMKNHELVSSIQNISTCQTHSRVPKCDHGFPVQINSNSVNGVVTTCSGVQKNLQKGVHSSGGSVCHPSKPQVTTVRLPSTRSKRMEHRCSKHKLVEPSSLCVPSNSSTSQSNTKGLPVQLPPNPDIPGLTGHALVLGPGPSISGNSASVTCISNSTQATRCFTTICNISTSMLGV